jgi:hypothetical protein
MLESTLPNGSLMNLFRRVFSQTDEPTLTEICFNASKDDDLEAARKHYEDLAEERRKLKRKLKQMGEADHQHTPEAKKIQRRISVINAEIGVG